MADRPTLLLVCDAGERASLSAALSEPGGDGGQVTWGDGGDDTVPLFAQLRPDVVVVTASLDAGDARFLLEVLRADRRSFRAVLIGDGDGRPVRTALDATEFGVDRFVPRPVDDQALRLAVASSLPAPAARSRWEAMADRIGGQDVAPPPAARDPEPGLTFAAPPPLVIRPRRAATAPAHATPARGPATGAGRRTDARRRAGAGGVDDLGLAAGQHRAGAGLRRLGRRTTTGGGAGRRPGPGA